MLQSRGHKIHHFGLHCLKVTKFLSNQSFLETLLRCKTQGYSTSTRTSCCLCIADLVVPRRTRRYRSNTPYGVQGRMDMISNKIVKDQPVLELLSYSGHLLCSTVVTQYRHSGVSQKFCQSTRQKKTQEKIKFQVQEV